jgi:hypothetical protein
MTSCQNPDPSLIIRKIPNEFQQRHNLKNTRLVVLKAGNVKKNERKPALGMVPHACNSRTMAVESELSWVPGKPPPYKEICLKITETLYKPREA